MSEWTNDTPRREPAPPGEPAFGPDDDPWAEPLPPSGGQTHGGGGDGGGGEFRCFGPCPICRAADIFRATAPPELQEHWHSFQREALLAVRALIEHHLQNLDREGPRPGSAAGRAADGGVEDIPID